MNPLRKRPSARRVPPPLRRSVTLSLTEAEFAELTECAKRAGLGEADWASHLVLNAARLANSLEALFPREEKKP